MASTMLIMASCWPSDFEISLQCGSVVREWVKMNLASILYYKQTVALATLFTPHLRKIVEIINNEDKESVFKGWLLKFPFVEVEEPRFNFAYDMDEDGRRSPDAEEDG